MKQFAKFIQNIDGGDSTMPSFIPCETTYRHKDISEWSDIDLIKPPEGELILVTDADHNGWCDCTFEVIMKKGKLYFKNGRKSIDISCVTYWKKA